MTVAEQETTNALLAGWNAPAQAPAPVPVQVLPPVAEVISPAVAQQAAREAAERAAAARARAAHAAAAAMEDVMRQQEQARQHEQARQDELTRQREVVRQAELTRQQELARQDELARQIATRLAEQERRQEQELLLAHERADEQARAEQARAELAVTASERVLVSAGAGIDRSIDIGGALPPVPLFIPDERPIPSSATPVTPGRRAQKEFAKARRTKKIKRVSAITVVLGLLAGAGVAVGVTTFAVHESKPAPKKAVVAAPARTQHTLLFALGDTSGDEAALLASDSKAGTASVTLLPSGTVTTVAGNGQVPLGKAVALPDAETGAGAVSDLLGVTVDQTWRISPTALASLIDSLGGITVTVDAQIISGGSVILQPGTQHVGGADAVAFAQYLASGEDETARLARLQSVLSGLLSVSTSPTLATAIGALGGGSQSSLSPAALAEVLRQTAGGHGPGGTTGPTFSLLPVTTIDTGGSTPAYGVDTNALANYVKANLADSVPEGGQAGALRVFVYSGTLEYGLGLAARKDLVAAGLSFVGSGNVAAPSSQLSVVLVPDATNLSRARGLRVAKALHLPASSVQVSEVSQDVADVVVIAGPDFHY